MVKSENKKDSIYAEFMPNKSTPLQHSVSKMA